KYKHIINYKMSENKRSRAIAISKNYGRIKAKNEIKEKSTINHINNKKIDKIHQIYENLCNRMYCEFKNRNILFRGTSYKKLIGCDTEILEEHLKKQFIDDMSFDNYGLWEVDHIYPISKINFDDMNEIHKYFNYANLQPLWKKDNIKKSNKIL